MGGLTYIGEGRSYLLGVPARDLTAAEVEKYGRERLIISGLYVPTVAGDLASAIQGIGPARADQLATWGIHTLDDLANADGDDLADAFARYAVAVSRDEVGRWIAQARAQVGG